mmetsp:Transcript_27150/g.49018  ORF Transcript_27150/g.49018 Transcript_27150/m.49018 type:complete len:248 (-) Transcript_27150:962-1705(-)
MLWLRRWRLCLLHEWDFVLLPQAQAGHGPRFECRHWEPWGVRDTARPPTTSWVCSLWWHGYWGQVCHEHWVVLCSLPHNCSSTSMALDELHAAAWRQTADWQHHCIPAPAGLRVPWGDCWGWSHDCEQQLGGGFSGAHYPPRFRPFCAGLCYHPCCHVVPVLRGGQGEAPRPACHLLRQAHLVHDLAVHHDLWLLHWVLQRIPQVDSGCFWLPARRLRQPQRSIRGSLCVAGCWARVHCTPFWRLAL